MCAEYYRTFTNSILLKHHLGNTDQISSIFHIQFYSLFIFVIFVLLCFFCLQPPTLSHYLPYQPCPWCVPPASRWENGKAFSEMTSSGSAAGLGSDSRREPSSCVGKVSAPGYIPTPGVEQKGYE